MKNFFSEQAMREISERQANWAALREIDVDADAATRRLEDNLLEPLSPAAAQQLEAMPVDAGDATTKPREQARLDSTWALVTNVFDPWCRRDCAPLIEAADLPACEAALEYPQPIRRHGASAESIAPADLLLRPAVGRPVAVTASFTEPYRKSGPEPKRPFAGFSDPGVWGRLQGCRNLALDRASNASRFQRLAATRLLERSLALTEQFGGRGFRLLHLWYEVPGHAATQMRREIDRFRMRVGGEVDFVSLTWQEFFSRVADRAGDDVGYAERVAARYFSR